MLGASPACEQAKVRGNGVHLLPIPLPWIRSRTKTALGEVLSQKGREFMNEFEAASLRALRTAPVRSQLPEDEGVRPARRMPVARQPPLAGPDGFADPVGRADQCDPPPAVVRSEEIEEIRIHPPHPPYRLASLPFRIPQRSERSGSRSPPSRRSGRSGGVPGPRGSDTAQSMPRSP